jgi:hypothetical protein
LGQDQKGAGEFVGASPHPATDAGQAFGSAAFLPGTKRE